MKQNAGHSLIRFVFLSLNSKEFDIGGNFYGSMLQGTYPLQYIQNYWYYCPIKHRIRIEIHERGGPTSNPKGYGTPR